MYFNIPKLVLIAGFKVGSIKKCGSMVTLSDNIIVFLFLNKVLAQVKFKRTLFAKYYQIHENLDFNHAALHFYGSPV